MHVITAALGAISLRILMSSSVRRSVVGEALQELGEIDDIDVLEVLKCTLNSNSIKRLASLTETIYE
jgi:hypothetical protein